MQIQKLLQIIDSTDEWDWPNKAYSNRCFYSSKTKLALFDINKIRAAIFVPNGIRSLTTDQEFYLTPHNINNKPYMEWLWEHLCHQYVK